MSLLLESGVTWGDEDALLKHRIHWQVYSDIKLTYKFLSREQRE